MPRQDHDDDDILNVDDELVVLLERATQAYKDGKYSLSLRIFTKVLDTDPFHKQALFFKKKIDRLAGTGEIELRTMSDEDVCSWCDGEGLCVRCGGSGRCPKCLGEGFLENLGKSCRHCRGTGQCQRCFGTGSCFRCEGSGEEPDVEERPCPVCDATGDCSVCYGNGKCRNCMGEGWNNLLDEPCSHCQGEGTCTACDGNLKCQVCSGKGKISFSDME